jgi:hypothetical protein
MTVPGGPGPHTQGNRNYTKQIRIRNANAWRIGRAL